MRRSGACRCARTAPRRPSPSPRRAGRPSAWAWLRRCADGRRVEERGLGAGASDIGASSRLRSPRSGAREAPSTGRRRLLAERRRRSRRLGICAFAERVQSIIEVHSIAAFSWILLRFGNASGAMRSTIERIAFAAGSRTSSWMSGTPRLLASSTAEDFGTSTSTGAPMMFSTSLIVSPLFLSVWLTHDVPVAGHEPERREQLELGAQRPQARHAHVRHEHGVGDVLERDERVLTEAGRRVDDRRSGTIARSRSMSRAESVRRRPCRRARATARSR